MVSVPGIGYLKCTKGGKRRRKVKTVVPVGQLGSAV
jgi:hypothetical protein